MAIEEIPPERLPAGRYEEPTTSLVDVIPSFGCVTVTVVLIFVFFFLFESCFGPLRPKGPLNCAPCAEDTRTPCYYEQGQCHAAPTEPEAKVGTEP